jgi:sulfite exporter TauE/SafE
MIPPIEIILTVFISSLLGSLHCVGMCGGLVALCSIHTQDRGINKNGIISRLLNNLPEAAYHFMRLLSYLILGFLAGVLGSIGHTISEAAGFQRGFSILAGSILILWGLRDLNLFSNTFRFLASRQGFQNALSIKFISSKIFKYPLQLQGVMRGAFIGLMSGILPCGWLYAYVLSASTTQNPLAGMIIMTSFWLGTVPVLVIFARVIKKIDSKLLSKIPKVTAFFIIILGILTITQTGKVLEKLDLKTGKTSEQSCH